MKKRFVLTFDVVTPESAEQGDTARAGFVPRTGNIPARSHHPKNPARFTLREAVEILMLRDSPGPVEADRCPVSRACPPRWFNYGGSVDLDGEATRVSLHLPRGTTPATAIRIARLLGCCGIRA